MEANKTFLAESTFAERERKLRMIAKRFEELCKEYPELEKDPDKWTERELSQYSAGLEEARIEPRDAEEEPWPYPCSPEVRGKWCSGQDEGEYASCDPASAILRGPSLSETR